MDEFKISNLSFGDNAISGPCKHSTDSGIGQIREVLETALKVGNTQDRTNKKVILAILIFEILVVVARIIVNLKLLPAQIL